MRATPAGQEVEKLLSHKLFTSTILTFFPPKSHLKVESTPTWWFTRSASRRHGRRRRPRTNQPVQRGNAAYRSPPPSVQLSCALPPPPSSLLLQAALDARQVDKPHESAANTPSEGTLIVSPTAAVLHRRRREAQLDPHRGK